MVAVAEVVADSFHYYGIPYTSLLLFEIENRGKYNDDKKLMIMEIVEYLGRAFEEQHKFLKKSNIPMIMVLSKLALENQIEPEQFKVFIDSFSNAVCVDYESNTGSGNIKRVKTEGRLLAIATAFAEHFDLDDIHILNIDGGTEEVCESEAGAENSELDSVDDALQLQGRWIPPEHGSIAVLIEKDGFRIAN